MFMLATHSRWRRVALLRRWLAPVQIALALTSFSARAFALDVAPPPLVKAASPALSQYVREVFQDRHGNYWFGTNHEGVARYDGSTLTFFNTSHGLAGNALRGIAQADDGTLWFATDGGVSRYRDGSFRNYTMTDGLSDASIWSMLLDRSGTLWVGTQEGVCRLVGDRFVAFPLPRVTVEKPESRFSPKVVFAMCQDQAGNLWFGTDGEGVHRYDGTSFASYTTKHGLASTMVRALCVDRRGRVWIGSDGGGVSYFDGSTFRTITSREGLNNDRVFEIHEDRAGILWFSTLGAGVCRYDGEAFLPAGPGRGLSFDDIPCACGSGKMTSDCHGTGGVHVQDIFEDRDGTLWFGCSGGLFRLDGDSFVHVTRDGPWQRGAETRDAISVAGPLAPFAGMVGGEWRVTFASGTKQFDRWSWGPGRHSIVSQTYGTDASSAPWRALNIYYRYPGSQDVRALHVHPLVPAVGWGYAEGRTTTSNERVSSRMQLQQSLRPDRPRSIELRWEFAHPDAYRSTLLEDVGRGYEELVGWDYARSYELSPLPDVAKADAVPPTSMTSAVAVITKLLGHRWTTERESHNQAPLQVEATLTWIPYLEAVHTHLALTGDGHHLGSHADVYLVRGPSPATFRALILTASGCVYEGDATMPDASNLTFTLTGHERDGVVERRGEIRLQQNGSIEARVWSAGDTSASQLVDLRLTPIATDANADR